MNQNGAPMHYEWGTLQPGGNVCDWDTEDQARQAHAISKRFPNGDHPVVRRQVGPWLTADQCDGECHERDDEDCPRCDSGGDLMCDSCLSYATEDAEPFGSGVSV
jgi:hypothetical protein